MTLKVVAAVICLVHVAVLLFMPEEKYMSKKGQVLRHLLNVLTSIAVICVFWFEPSSVFKWVVLCGETAMLLLSGKILYKTLKKQ